ncbi:hypothetical protein HCG51_19070 [Tolypothrix sp. PCC 7910]|uniref:hypothetical protein n=1 Tax=Tolypothrix sp. PCC 7910 TaxID=2099387 RepID=UPI001427974E|nr:hypothetical protein [Tolypothrix sp. PCC 7910]QIR38592.1 hypothetical protein HCG51_19070 [Tolypothrix sp. PCC 7910]
MKTMNLMNDQILIEQYIQGKIKLGFSHNFRIESIGETVQLLTKNGFFIATTNLADETRVFQVRQESHHWECLNQILLDNKFMPTIKSGSGLLQYEYYPLPKCYKMHYTEALDLWKLWRSHSHQKGNNCEQLNLLVLNNNNWQKIQDIAFSRESVFIKTPADEIVVDNCDRVIWLLYIQEEPELATVIQTSKVVKENNSPKMVKETEYKAISVAQDKQQNDYLACETNPFIASLVSSPTVTSNNIVKLHQGKLYIQTPEGEIVVEGSNLKFWFTQPGTQNLVPQSLVMQ